MSEFQTILLETKGRVAYLTLNRPEVMNAISTQMIDELNQAVGQLGADSEAGVLIISGAGRAFQAGADISELNRMTPLELLRWNQGIVAVGAALERLRQPVIAAINGAAMGGGLELALACTLRVAAVSAKLALPEVKLGIIPGAGGCVRLPRLIGKSRAAKLILTGKVVEAAEALGMGLVDEIAPDGEAVAVAEKLAARILANGPVAVELAKDAIEMGMDMPAEAAMHYAQKNCVVCFSTQDMIEGTSAFLEKRKPQFKGR